MKSRKSMSKKSLAMATLVFFSGFNSGVAEPVKTKTLSDPVDCVLESYEGSGIGDVKISILSEADFQAVHGDEWVLLKGQTISSLSYGSYDPANGTIADALNEGAAYNSQGQLPDASGKFLRMANTDSTDSNQNTESKKIGEYQGGSTALPLSPFVTSTDGAHTHDYIDSRLSYVGGSADVDGASSRVYDIIDSLNTTSSSGAHSHTVASGGDAETRPRNITVNVFVKVRRACLNKSITDGLRASYCGPTDTTAYPQGCFGLLETDNTERSAKVACLKAALTDWENETGMGKVWSSGCLMQVVGTSKKILIDLGAAKTQDEVDWLAKIIEQYPYYNAVTGVPQ